MIDCLTLKWSKLSFGQKFINYLGPVNFNSLPIDIKKNILNDNINIKKCLNFVSFTEIIHCL